MRRSSLPAAGSEATAMQGLLIADKDVEARRQMAELFIEDGYDVIVTNSAANALSGILKNAAQVVLVGSEFDDLTAADFVPLLKKCNPELTVILVSGEHSPAFLRRLRREGIFYHALKPLEAEEKEEIRQAVHCAFEKLHQRHGLHA